MHFCNMALFEMPGNGALQKKHLYIRLSHAYSSHVYYFSEAGNYSMGSVVETVGTEVSVRNREGMNLVGTAYGDPACPPVLFLHGGGQTRHSWGGTAETLARSGYYCITIDHRGHGHSDWAPNGSYEYIDHERFIDRGVPTANGEPVEAFEEIVFGDPDNNYQTLGADVFRANVEHTFSDNLKGNFNAFYGDYDKVYSTFYAAGYNAETEQVTLDGYVDTTQRENMILSSNLVGEFETGSIGHTVIFGGEVINTKSNQDRYNPVFDSTDGDRETFNISRPLSFRGLTGTNAEGVTVTADFSDLNDDTHVDLDVYSFYVQDEIALSDNFDLVLGARFDSFDIEVFNADPEVLETRSRKDEEVSPRAGLVYKPQKNISIYASYSESFLPRSGEQYANINGDANALDPDTFTNQEIGVKWDFNDSMSFTAAIFENEQTSLDNDPNDPESFVEVDSDVSGFELQLQGYITDKWYITANYSNLDGENASGVELRELPENTMSVWTTYEVNEVFGFGIGATYQDESKVSTSATSPVLPSYTRVDASAYYTLSDKMRLQLNVENLTDTLYFPNAHSTHQVTVGAPINARLSLIGSF